MQIWSRNQHYRQFACLHYETNPIPQYREATFGEETGGSLQVGKVFAELCDMTGANFAAFGTNVFANTYGAADKVICSLDIEWTA